MDEQELVDTMLREHIYRAFNQLGIEGTEEALLKTYGTMPELQKRYLDIYCNIIETYKRK